MLITSAPQYAPSGGKTQAADVYIVEYEIMIETHLPKGLKRISLFEDFNEDYITQFQTSILQSILQVDLSGSRNLWLVRLVRTEASTSNNFPSHSWLMLGISSGHVSHCGLGTICSP
jgi:hypothetical protein